MSVTTSKVGANYIASPLPFMGQKRNFSKKFIKELNHFPDDLIIVDLFGGSGILSHVAKQNKPTCRVIYNDFDNYELRMKSVKLTNEIIDFARDLLQGLKKGSRVPEELKTKILKKIKSLQDKSGYVDYITLSSNFLFSGKYVKSYTELEKQGWYAKVRQSPICVDGYLEGVEIVRFDYRDLYDRFKNYSNVLFIIDPPYLQTQSVAYSRHWNLSEHLDTLSILQSSKFFYFTSSKSHIIELMDWLDKNDYAPSPFKCCKRISHRQHVSGLSSYEDIMFVKG